MKKRFFFAMALVLSLMIIPVVKAEKLVPADEAGSYGANGKSTMTSAASTATITPKVGTIDEGNTYNVKLEWGSMTYNYVKQSDDTYKWVPTKDEVLGGKNGEQYLIVETDSNYINVTNDSSKSVNVELSWSSLINGVEANYSAVDRSNNPVPISGKADSNTKMYTLEANGYIKASIELTGGDIADVTAGANIGTLTVSFVTA